MHISLLSFSVLFRLIRLLSIFFALICRPASAAESASIRALDSNPLSRLNPKIPKKQQLRSSSSSSAPGSTPVVPSLVARNSTRMTVRAIPRNSILNRPSENSFVDKESITVRCRVKCIVSKLEDLPTVSFYVSPRGEINHASMQWTIYIAPLLKNIQ